MPEQGRKSARSIAGSVAVTRKTQRGSVAGTSEKIAVALVQEQQKVCDFLNTWTVQQSAWWNEHAAKNEQLVSSLLDMHKQTLQNLQQLAASTEPAVSPEPDPGGDIKTASITSSKTALTTVHTEGRNDAATCDKEIRFHADVAQGEGKQPTLKIERTASADRNTSAIQINGKSVAETVAANLECLEKDEVILDNWRRSSGLHTVEKWVKNYRKHPAGWAALLAIHGVPEVTGRLRTKVENYAIYSALFLSMSIALMVDAPDAVTANNPNDEWSVDWWLVEIRRRDYFYGLAISTGAHMLSILLAMAFVNALNETARDADVYRLFSRGKGYIATVKCQQAFRYGCVATYVGMVAGTTTYIHTAEVVVIGLATLLICGKVLTTTSSLLFSAGSIVKYWRTELGGQPDADDPYELLIPMKCFDQRVQTNTELSKEETGLFHVDLDPYTDGVQNDLFDALRRDDRMSTETTPQGSAAVGARTSKVGLAAIF